MTKKNQLNQNEYNRYLGHQKFLKRFMHKSMDKAEYAIIVQLTKTLVDLVVTQPFITNKAQFINIACEFNLIVHTTDSNGNALKYYNYLDSCSLDRI